jgi:hypothetical protein
MLQYRLRLCRAAVTPMSWVVVKQPSFSLHTVYIRPTATSECTTTLKQPSFSLHTVYIRPTATSECTTTCKSSRSGAERFYRKADRIPEP